MEKNISSSNNPFNSKNKFITFNFINNIQIKYDDYYFYNKSKKLYSCKFCSKIKPIKYKFAIKRHISKQHFFKKTKCNKCHKEVLRLDENSKRC